jgi:hypothetical protein
MNPKILVVALACCLGSAQARGDELPTVAGAKPYATSQLVNILRQAGYVDIEAEAADQIHFKRSGQVFYLNRYEDGDLVLYFGLTGFEHLRADDFNRWNREKRLTRAYLDDDGDAVLESDMLFDGGLSPRKIAVWVNVFVGLVDGFEDFLSGRNTANKNVAPAAAESRASSL